MLRKAALNRLPPEVAFRGKVGFSVPLRAWMRGAARRESIQPELRGSSSALFFERGLVESFWRSFMGGNDNVWHIVYAIYVFLVWYRECFSEGME